MGPKRWQVNQLEARLRLKERQLQEAMRVIVNYIDYFDKVGKDGNALRRAKERIEAMTEIIPEREQSNQN